MNRAVFGESIVASTTSSATWMPSARNSCAAAWVIARVAAAAAAHRPRPGIARRAEPPVIWISVPAPARTPSLRNTNAWRASPTVHVVEVLELGLAQRPAAERAVRVRDAPR